ncbi:MAG: hypothetical protein JXQ87_10390 [Bacteroidia bacterium]
MPTAIQVFTNFNRLFKHNYKEWRANYEWPKAIESKNGSIEDRTLVLPNFIINQDAQKANLIIINDIIGFDKEAQLRKYLRKDLPDWYKNRIQEQIKQVKEHYFFQNTSSICRVEILNFKQIANDNIEVYLDYQNHKGTIGKPTRQNHKIAELRPGSFIRYSINGKYDFNLSSGAERTYHEYDYIIKHLGQFNDVEFLGQKQISNYKQIELPSKWVNEKKVLF